MSSKNLALYFNGPNDVSVSSKAIPTPGKDELVIKVMASGMAIIDAALYSGRFPAAMFLKEIPAILGLDPAGIVHSVGEDVKGLKVGDRVVPAGKYTTNTGGWQQYAISTAALTTKIPDLMSFDEAATFPLNLATAAIGLYAGPEPTAPGCSGAGLTAPWDEGGLGKYSGRPILVTGGSSSVGQFVIQLAKLSGFSPILTTASTKHTELLKALGATVVLDRSLPTDELITAAKFAAGNEPIKVAYDVVTSEDFVYGTIGHGGAVITHPRRFMDKNLEEKNLTVHRVYGAFSLPENYEIGAKAYVAFGKWFESGDLKPIKPEVLPGGLNGIVAGLERITNSQVSGVKLVVHPQETE